MADVETPTGYLSIGEVLGILLEEFPDVTISKIRFLESQGLISPERTASGYRKFYEADVDLLRVILTEQRENYLPLRVIKDRLDSGEIDPTGEHLRPNGERFDDMLAHGTEPRLDLHHGDVVDDPPGADELDHTPVEVPRSAIRSHPASRGVSERDPVLDRPDAPAPIPIPAIEPVPAAEPPQRPSAKAQLLPGVLLDRGELCAMVGMSDAELTALESFGVITARQGSSTGLYGDDAVETARPACEFLRLGVDARHLRQWRTSAEREASLYEQLVAPRYRQRNPEARAEALAQLRRLDTLGGALRAAMMRQVLRNHFEA